MGHSPTNTMSYRFVATIYIYQGVEILNSAMTNYFLMCSCKTTVRGRR